MSEISRNYDAKIFPASDSIEFFKDICQQGKEKTRLVSQFLFNIWRGHHFLFRIGDTSVPDIDSQIRLLIKNAIDEGYVNPNSGKKVKANNTGLRDAFDAFNLSRKQGRTKTGRYSNALVEKAYEIRSEECCFDWRWLSSLFSAEASKNTPFVDVGIAHTLSYISNLKNTLEDIRLWKDGRRQFLENESKYAAVRPRILELEKQIKSNIQKFYPPLTCNWLKNEFVRKLVDKKITEEILETHREFHNKYKRPPRKTKFNPVCTHVFYKKSLFSITNLEQNQKDGHFSGLLIFRKNKAKLLLRPPKDGFTIDDLRGIAFREVLDDGSFLCSIRVTKSVEFGDSDFTKTAFVDVSWSSSRQTIVSINGQIYRLSLFQDRNLEILKKYDSLRRDKKKIPSSLKKKRKQIVDYSRKLAANKIAQICAAAGCAVVVSEPMSPRSKKYKIPPMGRWQESRTNYLASAIGAKEFESNLREACEKRNIRLQYFKFKANDRGTAYFRPSQTCPVCNGLGQRFSITEGKNGPVIKHAVSGKYLCCPKGHVCDSDVAAVRNMARRDHPDEQKRLISWKKGTRLSDEQKEICKKHLQSVLIY